MNEQKFRDALRDIAHKEIPDTMDRWELIQSKIRPGSRGGPLAWSLTRLAVVFAVLILSLLTIAVGYAVFFHWGDPGMSSVEKAGLITPVQMTALPTIIATSATPEAGAADVVVTMDTIYADKQRIGVTFTLRNLPALPQGDNYDILTVITHPDGSQFHANGGGGMDSGPEPNSLVLMGTYNYDEPIPESGQLDLVFTLRVNPTALMPDQTPLYTFSFPVTLTVVDGISIQPNQSQTVSGVEVILKSIEITASGTKLKLCVISPSDHVFWMPEETEIAIDGEPGYPLQSLPESSADPTLACTELAYTTPYKPGEKHLSFKVLGLYADPPSAPSEEYLAAVKEQLAAQGIEVKFKTDELGLAWDIIKKPDTMTDSDVDNVVHDVTFQRITGPWVFEVDIPQGK